MSKVEIKKAIEEELKYFGINRPTLVSNLCRLFESMKDSVTIQASDMTGTINYSAGKSSVISLAELEENREKS